MDDLTDNFGLLSTSAREWTPGGGGSGGQEWEPADSELSATAVKEFIPGQGWSTQAAQESAPEQDHEGRSRYDTGYYEREKF